MIDFYYKEEMGISINDIKYIKALVTTGPTQKTTVSKRPSNSSDVKNQCISSCFLLKRFY